MLQLLFFTFYSQAAERPITIQINLSKNEDGVVGDKHLDQQPIVTSLESG